MSKEKLADLKDRITRIQKLRQYDKTAAGYGVNELCNIIYEILEELTIAQT